MNLLENKPVSSVFLARAFQQQIAESRVLWYWAAGVIFSIVVNIFLRRNQLGTINTQTVLMVFAACGFAIWGIPKASRTGLISVLFFFTSVGLILKANSFAIVLPTNSAVETYTDFGNIGSENKPDTIALLKKLSRKPPRIIQSSGSAVLYWGSHARRISHCCIIRCTMKSSRAVSHRITRV